MSLANSFFLALGFLIGYLAEALCNLLTRSKHEE